MKITNQIADAIVRLKQSRTTLEQVAEIHYQKLSAKAYIQTVYGGAGIGEETTRYIERAAIAVLERLQNTVLAEAALIINLELKQIKDALDV